MATSSNKAVPLIVAFVAGVAIGYLGSMVPPDNDGMTGTVAPAQRYRANQMSSEDVVLGDQALVDLMQTDAFTAIMNDPELASLIADGVFQNLRNH